jgi:hypothetical protein
MKADPLSFQFNSPGTWKMIVLDKRKGDVALARDFLQQNGFFGVAAEQPTNDLYFAADTRPPEGSPKGDPERAIELACRASWLSGVPFKAVNIMGPDGPIADVKAD